MKSLIQAIVGAALLSVPAVSFAQSDGRVAINNAAAFMALVAILIGGLLASMHFRHQYHPNLIGALIGALFCFLLLEALPAIT